MNDEAPSMTEDSQLEQTRDGLASRSYLGLWLTQFLGALNDNAFRWLAVPVGKMVMDCLLKPDG